jgi:hypothetical protein
LSRNSLSCRSVRESWPPRIITGIASAPPTVAIDEEVPEVLLTLRGRLVRTAQLPIARALVQPADEPVIALTAEGVHPRAGLFGVFASLPSNFGRPPICSRHG